MLNDPAPDDLPEPPSSPYAALPPELATRTPARGLRRRWIVGAVAIITIVALLAGTLLVI